MKRIVLFLVTNLAIVLALSVTLRLLGVEPYLQQQGLALGPLLVFAAVFGMGGAFISLAISKMIATRETLQRIAGQPPLPDKMAAFGIDGGQGMDIKRLFMTHPPLAERIAALRGNTRN